MTETTALATLARQIAHRLDPDGTGGRRHVDDLAPVLAELRPHLPAAEHPGLLGEVIAAGGDVQVWEPAKTVTVTVGAYTLPKHVTLPRSSAEPARQPVDVPMRPELSWAAGLRLNGQQRQLLQAVSDWLRETDGGRDVPVVAAAERAYQLTGNEKAFDRDVPAGGRTLWRPGRLTFDMLRCRREPTPLTWEPVGAVADGPVLAVENHATFRTVLRWCRQRPGPRWVAVCWVAGRNTAPLSSLSRLPFAPSRLDYLGDLDVAGLEIAAEACRTAEQAAVPAGPAEGLWELLAAQPAQPASSRPDPARVAEVCAWLPAPAVAAARQLLLAGRRVPQEALRLDVLDARPGSDPVDDL